jgi:hypothetical protein
MLDAVFSMRLELYQSRGKLQFPQLLVVKTNFFKYLLMHFITVKASYEYNDVQFS